MSEIIKTIKDYEGVYYISNQGNVYSKKNGAYGLRDKLKKLKPLKSNGYESVIFSVNGVRKKFKVHRLVLMTFTPLKDWKDQVNHKNGIKNDNRIENLEWVTQSENMLHRSDILGFKHLSGSDHPNSTQVTIIKNNYCREFDTVSECSKFIGVTHTAVCQALKNKSKCKGYFVVRSIDKRK